MWRSTPAEGFLDVNNENESGRAAAVAIGTDGGLTMLNSTSGS
jgi:hypothetical protein